MTAEKKASEQSVTIELHSAEKSINALTVEKNLGCAVAMTQYAALGIDLNALCRLLVCERIVKPSSELSAWQRRGSYFFRSKFSDDDIYRGLDALADMEPSVVSAMNRAVCDGGIRDSSAVYYDVTNYYFEIDEEDDLKSKGVSKEHRPDPIIQMGLLQDANAILIAYRLFSGNTHDSATMIRVMADLKGDYVVWNVSLQLQIRVLIAQQTSQLLQQVEMDSYFPNPSLLRNPMQILKLGFSYSRTIFVRKTSRPSRNRDTRPYI